VRAGEEEGERGAGALLRAAAHEDAFESEKHHPGRSAGWMSAVFRKRCLPIAETPIPRTAPCSLRRSSHTQAHEQTETHRGLGRRSFAHVLGALDHQRLDFDYLAKCQVNEELRVAVAFEVQAVVFSLLYTDGVL